VFAVVITEALKKQNGADRSRAALKQNGAYGMSTAYSSSPIPESENSHAPTLRLEVIHERSPNSMTKFQLAKAILDLYRMGLITEYVGEEEQGPARFSLVEGRSL
jgi:hypothetical protein